MPFRVAASTPSHGEGEVICILVSEISMDDLLALTKSKARAE